MPENLQPENMSTWMRDVERRLAAVERPSRLSTVQYGSIVSPGTGSTSTTFFSAATCNVSKWVADSITFTISANTVVPTDVGEVYVDARVFDPSGIISLPTTTNTVSFSGEKIVQWDWRQPDLAIGDMNMQFRFRLRRASGTAEVNMFVLGVIMQPSFVENAVADGNGRII